MPTQASNFISKELRRSSDRLFQLKQGAVKLDGYLDQKINIVIRNILKALDYSKMTDYFRYQPGIFAAGEFWGKIVRAACLAFQYTQDPELKIILDKTIVDILSLQSEDGCISNFPIEQQPYGSDMWERKYILLGLESYYEITHTPNVLKAMIKLADYTLTQVGHPPKVRIVDTGWAFSGIESSSILEPIVKLYHLTGYQRYLDFAKYIVEDEGACKRVNIFEAVFKGVDPKDIGGNGNPTESIAKAYEMMSCFEGLVEYYRATGIEHWKEAALIFYRKLCEQEITVIGSGGADKPYNLGLGTGEQWNYTAYEQTNPDIELMQETCVTVTWIKFCYQILRLTGDSNVADQIEKSIYNALLGALKPTGNYFEYFPKLNGARSNKINFGYNIGEFPLSCCTANGPMGMTIIPFFAIMNSQYGPVINLYSAGCSTIVLQNGHEVKLLIVADYPVTGNVVIYVMPEQKEEFSIYLRIPAWSKETTVLVNECNFNVFPGTYAEIKRTWLVGDKIILLMDMRCRVISAPYGSNRAGDNYIALTRGPVILARDRRLCDLTVPIKEIKVDKDGYAEIKCVNSTINARMQFLVSDNNNNFEMVDYASAGSTWNEESEFQTWLPKTPI